MPDKTLDTLIPVDFNRSSRRYSALSAFDDQYNPVDYPLVYVLFDQIIRPTAANLPIFFDNAKRSGASRISLIVEGRFTPEYNHESVRGLQFSARYLAFDVKRNLLLRRNPERLYEIIILKSREYVSSDCLLPSYTGKSPWTKLLKVGKERAEESSAHDFYTRLKINLPADSGYRPIRCTLAPQEKFHHKVDLLVKNKRNLK